MGEAGGVEDALLERSVSVHRTLELLERVEHLGGGLATVSALPKFAGRRFGSKCARVVDCVAGAVALDRAGGALPSFAVGVAGAGRGSEHSGHVLAWRSLPTLVAVAEVVAGGVVVADPVRDRLV